MKKVFLIFIIFLTLSYSQISKKISVGEISIFTEPYQEEITQWAEYDKFLLDNYYYVKNEKQELESYPMNPFKDSNHKKTYKSYLHRHIQICKGI